MVNSRLSCLRARRARGRLVSRRVAFRQWDRVSHRVLGYAACGVALGALALWLSPAVEAPASGGPAVATGPTFLGLRESRGLVLRLSALFRVDSFGGGFVLQSFSGVVAPAKIRRGRSSARCGVLRHHLLSASPASPPCRSPKKIGLINTMVWTHLPSNVLLMLVPLIADAAARDHVAARAPPLSQMDVPTRASYLSAIIPARERPRPTARTSTAKQLGTALGRSSPESFRRRPQQPACPLVCRRAEEQLRFDAVEGVSENEAAEER